MESWFFEENLYPRIKVFIARNYLKKYLKMHPPFMVRKMIIYNEGHPKIKPTNRNAR
jgi:hypothetical protein